MTRPLTPTRAYCPTCDKRVHPNSVTTGGRGYCEQHGWIWVNWNPTGKAAA